MTMRALMRQTSELDALDAHIAAVTDPMVPMEDEGVATASVTPAKGVGVDGEAGGAETAATAKRAKKAFSIALEEEIEHMHGRECATPATTSSAVPLHAAVARGDGGGESVAPGRAASTSVEGTRERARIGRRPRDRWSASSRTMVCRCVDGRLDWTREMNTATRRS